MKDFDPRQMLTYIHYIDKSTGTPSLEEKRTLPNCANKDGNTSLVPFSLLKKGCQYFCQYNECTSH